MMPAYHGMPLTKSENKAGGGEKGRGGGRRREECRISVVWHMISKYRVSASRMA
jgi:hypothetical protein